MQNYNFFKAFYLSFYDKKFYQDIVKSWHGTGFAYLLLLLMITWIPSMYLFHRVIGNFSTEIAPQVIEQLPTIIIKNGEVSIDKKSPYFIKDPASESNLAVIDTSGKYKSLEDTPASILLTKNQLMTKNVNDEVNIYNLKNIKSMELTQAKIYKFLDYVKKWAALAMYPIFVVMSFLYRILWAFIYAAIGLFIFARMMNVSLEFKQVLRIAVVAMTPAIIISTVLEAMGVFLPLQNWILLFITLGYVYFGVAANKPVIAKRTDA